jgi:hypothetical protein
MAIGDTSNQHNNLDIIGDVHGYADVLRALLEKMGYINHGSEKYPNFRHPDQNRCAVFVGDFIDRGLKNLETVRIVQTMVKTGSALAIMGNHEFNALLYHTKDPYTGEPLRPHTEKNQKQHQTFLDEMKEYPEETQEALKWFRTLPLYLEFPECRVVHACWHLPSLEIIRPLLTVNNVMTDSLLFKAARKGTAEYQSIETILKGPELALPNGDSFTDPDGHVRHEIRLKWWTTNTRTYREAAQVDQTEQKFIPDTSLPKNAMDAFLQDDTMTFIGHYWLDGEPKKLSSNVTCVDYSVAKKGKLCAYRIGNSDNIPGIESGWVSVQSFD